MQAQRLPYFLCLNVPYNRQHKHNTEVYAYHLLLAPLPLPFLRLI